MLCITFMHVEIRSTFNLSHYHISNLYTRQYFCIDKVLTYVAGLAEVYIKSS
ncbi:hypothetical protein HanPI659440_Chr12g0470191 [Helianthus annuus]|nr:hypothetical protein HanPI659440_Chr12g0470191 [Helianthus annuus]